jgi:hypothetical protein
MPATVRSRGRSSSAPAKPAPRSDAYTGLLIISLLAQIAGAVFLYLDYSSYPDAKPPKPADRPAAITFQPPAPPAGNQPMGNQPMGNQPMGNQPMGNQPMGNQPMGMN